jgi:WD40 repeat protein
MDEDWKRLLALHDNSINSIQINGDILYTCCEDQLKSYSQETSKQETLFKSESGDIGIIKLLDDSHLLLTNSNDLHLFDVDSLKQTNKYKFCKDTINTIDVNKGKTILACGDDTGHVKLMDLRIQANSQIEIKLKNTLKKHTNLCYSLKFNQSNEHELMTSSYDCTVAKWDLRNLKSFSSCVNVNEILEATMQSETIEFISTMTPCFVHTLQFAHEDRLLVGIETGLCLGLDSENLAFKFSKQLQKPNSALTNMVFMQDLRLWACSGNDGYIRFFKVIRETDSLILLDDPVLEHGFKVNCLLYAQMKLYVGDTTNNVTIYDLAQIFKSNKI